MSANLFIVPDMTFQSSFVAEEMRALLMGLPHKTKCVEGDELLLSDMHLIECEFVINNEWTRVSVPKDLQYLTIEGTGNASLQLALNLQRGYNSDMYVVVSESPADSANLSTIVSIDELRDKLSL